MRHGYKATLRYKLLDMHGDGQVFKKKKLHMPCMQLILLKYKTVSDFLIM